MAERFKLVVIGAGPGGYVAAIRAGQLGIKTAIVEKEYFGGVCLNWGCIPSKALLYVTELKRTLESCGRLGLRADNIGIDIEKLKRHKNDTIKRLTGGVKLLLDKAGVKSYSGQASFVSKNEIEITNESNKTRIESDYFIIATGSSPIELPMIRTDGETIIGAREAINLPRIPGKLGVIGAGPIGVELATVYNTLGSEVTIIELLDAVLPMLDDDISSASKRALEKQGMKIYVSSKVISSKKADEKVQVEVETSGGRKTFIFDTVLVAAGMKPNSTGLNLQETGIKTDSKGFIIVDNKMRTNVSNILAIGDVTGGMLLAHKASHEGIIASEVIGGKNVDVDWKFVPYAVFTDPEVAGIGLTEKEAKQSSGNIKVGKFPYRAIGKAVATLATEGFVKVVADDKSGEVLGIHIFGPHSGDIILAGTTLLKFNGTVDHLGHIMAVHPTFSEAMMEAGLNANKKAIHIVN